jgi:cis-L-3-hydroxyproline dehydratase
MTDFVLTPHDVSMLNGDHGPAAQMAMRIVSKMATVAGAATLLDIEGAHIDSTVYIGVFAEKLAELGAKVRVPSTLNVSGLDEHHWQEWAVPGSWAHRAHRQMLAYQGMGTLPTWTCAPYQTEHKPRFGQQIAWGESNAIAYANTVIGARSERYPDLFDICCAITGRAPAIGLHLTQNRAADVVMHLENIPLALQSRDDFYPVLGHLIGSLAESQIPVVTGLIARPNEDQLKALCAAGACSGAVALCHIVGVTPEAPTLEAALQNTQPKRTLTITREMLRAARAELTHGATDGALHMVVLGSPHFSLAEFQQLAPLVAGRIKHPDVVFNITSSRAMTALAAKMGVLKTLTDFGAVLTVDTCMLTTPMLPEQITRLMTNSAKFAYYAPGLLNRSITFGSLEDCVNSAVNGRVMRDEGPWR